MNRSEYAVGEAVGAILGTALRFTFEFLLLIVMPALMTGAMLLFALHSWLTSQIMDAIEVSDSLFTRIAVGVIVFPITVAAGAALIGILVAAGFFLVIADLHPAIKIVIALMFVGALLSSITFVRDWAGFDAPLELDFDGLWSE